PSQVSNLQPLVPKLLIKRMEYYYQLLISQGSGPFGSSSSPPSSLGSGSSGGPYPPLSFRSLPPNGLLYSSLSDDEFFPLVPRSGLPPPRPLSGGGCVRSVWSSVFFLSLSGGGWVRSEWSSLL